MSVESGMRDLLRRIEALEAAVQEAARLLRSPAPAVEREPVAWGVLRRGRRIIYTRPTKAEAEIALKELMEDEVVALYTAPPPAVEREPVAWMVVTEWLARKVSLDFEDAKRMASGAPGKSRVVPLYTAPPPSVDVDALVERARAFGLTPAPVESPESDDAE